MPDKPAVIVQSRLVPANRQEAFDAWADRHRAGVRAAPGHRQSARLEQQSGLVHLLDQFDAREAADRWLGSPEHDRLAQEADGFSEGRIEVRDGDSVNLKIPSETVVPKWKLFLATFAAVFPLQLLLNTAIRALPFKLPQPVQLGLTSLIMVALLTWIILPQVKKLLRPWLFDDGDGGLRRDPD